MNFESLTVPKIKEFMKENNIDKQGKSKRQDLIDIILIHQSNNNKDELTSSKVNSLDKKDDLLQKNYRDMTLPELKIYMKENNIDKQGKTKKSDLIDIISNLENSSTNLLDCDNSLNVNKLLEDKPVYLDKKIEKNVKRTIKIKNENDTIKKDYKDMNLSELKIYIKDNNINIKGNLGKLKKQELIDAILESNKSSIFKELSQSIIIDSSKNLDSSKSLIVKTDFLEDNKSSSSDESYSLDCPDKEAFLTNNVESLEIKETNDLIIKKDILEDAHSNLIENKCNSSKETFIDLKESSDLDNKKYNLVNMTISELKLYTKNNNIDIKGKSKKQDIINIILECKKNSNNTINLNENENCNLTNINKICEYINNITENKCNFLKEPHSLYCKLHFNINLNQNDIDILINKDNIEEFIDTNGIISYKLKDNNRLILNINDISKPLCLPNIELKYILLDNKIISTDFSDSDISTAKSLNISTKKASEYKESQVQNNMNIKPKMRN